ncbi:MAG TPA: DUF1761 domain-containing protein [Candidatus Aquilonibacter sp.]|nr:DUF1761 domain-containing protein [Candidatus Aquilonibacter sp.]
MRVNWLAIGVSTIVFFLFGWAWYAAFGSAWANALGSTREAMMAANASNPYPYIVALVAAFFISYGVARVLSWHPTASPGRAAFIGFSLGFLFVGMSLWMSYAYEHRTIALGLINTGYYSFGMAIVAAILAAWKPKAA